jgi:hypothetical protein
MLGSHYFTCHWDDSGTDPGVKTISKANRSILLVGGYCAHVKGWRDFECKWNPILVDYGHRIGCDLRPFHMVDFTNYRYPYNKLTMPDYDSLITSLLDVINIHAKFFVAWAIEIDAYMEIIKARHLLETDIVRAYHICARKCIESVSLWAGIAKHQHKILHIFDRGNSAWPSFEDSFDQEFLNALNILQPISQSKEDVLPLQAADILAHQMARDLLISLGKIKEGRRNYIDILKVVPGISKYIDTTELGKLYNEELYLEQMRAIGRYPRRIIKQVKEEHVQLIEELFKEPENCKLKKLAK